jgi:CheY-like chemotaxis protein
MESRDEQLKNVRILVVEDDKDTREMLRFVLRQSGAAVRDAESVPQAMEAMKNEEPDILIVDIAMPEYNGYAMISQFREREQPGKPMIPAIALTAFTSDADRRTALSAGFQEYMSKPFHPAELIATVAKWAGPRKQMI